MTSEITLKQPTDAQNAAYLQCLRVDRFSFDERRAGRSGLLNVEQRAQHQAAGAIVGAALDDGVGFDRMDFGDVETGQ